MKTLSIEDERNKDGKGRKFRAAMLGYIRADMLWEGGMTATNNLRPIYMTLAGKEAALRPFLANMRKGRKVNILEEGRYRTEVDGRLELLKSAGYEFVWHRGKSIALVTAYQTSLFQADPGMIDHESISFISAPPLWWVRAQGDKLTAADVTRVRDHLLRLGVGTQSGSLPIPLRIEAADLRDIIAAAAHFCLYLDKRTRRPLINDLTFTTQLYLASLYRGAASYSANYHGRWCAHPWATNHRLFDGYSLGKLGFYPPTVVHLSQELMDKFLAEQIKLWRQP